MNRIKATLLLTIATLWALTAICHAETYGNFVYIISDGEITIIDYNYSGYFHTAIA